MDLPVDHSLHRGDQLWDSGSKAWLGLVSTLIKSAPPDLSGLFPELQEGQSDPVMLQRRSQEDYESVSSCSLSCSEHSG